jgi:hypothetical protein
VSRCDAASSPRRRINCRLACLDRSQVDGSAERKTLVSANPLQRQALQDRRPRHHQCSSDQVRHGVRLSSLRHGASCPRYHLRPDRLASSANRGRNRCRAPVSTRKPCNLGRRDSSRANSAIAAEHKHKITPKAGPREPKPLPHDWWCEISGLQTTDELPPSTLRAVPVT